MKLTKRLRQAKPEAETPIFNEETLKNEIARVWGAYGAHSEVYADLLKALSTERAARAAAERDVTRLNYLETHFHIDGTADEPVYSTFVPILKSGAQTLREAIDQALTTPGSHAPLQSSGTGKEG